MKTAKPRIVLIEDNELSRTLLRSILRNAGYEVIGEARDGLSGLEVVDRLQPDLVCLDVVMPKLDGMNVLAELRRETPDIPVIMITGHTDREAVENMIKEGASGIVVKPFNTTKVLAAVERSLAARA
ncbi:response regulator [Azoarcus taiwanensis]|uniref:Response regulator n=1 Tax=Azoarcus taiwanensis TaxID=666964 RepID=A0A972F9C4_9RHOO|nr:response regulator [Azoarcus taiwanensis]NMG04676.1 response regulator [Azoarcus taiwanensis]